MYTFLKIFLVVLLALVIAGWIADRDRRAHTNIPNSPTGWSLLSSNIKIRSAAANESPEGTALLLDETFLPGDVKYESPNGNMRIYFPVVTAILLSILFTAIIGLIRKAARSS